MSGMLLVLAALSVRQLCCLQLRVSELNIRQMAAMHPRAEMLQPDDVSCD